MSFNLLIDFFQNLGYERFMGPKLAQCLDTKSDFPNFLIFIKDEKRIPNQNWDFALLYEIEDLEHLNNGVCQIRSRAFLYSLNKKEKIANLMANINNPREFQTIIGHECFIYPNEINDVQKIEF